MQDFRKKRCKVRKRGARFEKIGARLEKIGARLEKRGARLRKKRSARLEKRGSEARSEKRVSKVENIERGARFFFKLPNQEYDLQNAICNQLPKRCPTKYKIVK